MYYLSSKKGKTYKINASVNKLKKNKKLMPESYATRLRYLSSSKSVATVSKKGRKKREILKNACSRFGFVV